MRLLRQQPFEGGNCLSACRFDQSCAPWEINAARKQSSLSCAILQEPSATQHEFQARTAATHFDNQAFDSQTSEDLSECYDDVYGLGFQCLPVGGLETHPEDFPVLEHEGAHCSSLRDSHQQLSEATSSKLTTSAQQCELHKSNEILDSALVVGTPAVAPYDSQSILSWLSDRNLSEFANQFIRAQVSFKR